GRGREDGGRVAELRARGKRCPRRGQAAPPHPPQEIPESAPPGHPPPGRCADPRGHDGEPQPLAVQDCETDEGRGPLRTKGYLAPLPSPPPWSFRFQALQFPRDPRTS